MSKQNPNQQYYKTAGRAQSDGSDRAEDLQQAKQEFARVEKDAKHPAARRAKKK